MLFRAEGDLGVRRHRRPAGGAGPAHAHARSVGIGHADRPAREVAGAQQPVEGAAANDLPGAVAPEVKEERYARVMELTARISAEKLAAKVGRRIEVIVDSVDEDGATCRTKADAPEIDGNLFIDDGFEALTPGDIVTVTVDEAGEYDLWGRLD